MIMLRVRGEVMSDLNRTTKKLQIFQQQQQKDESDRRTNSKFVPDCWDENDSAGSNSDPSKPPCIWDQFPDEP